MNRWQAGLADAGWNSLYWCNHDQPRVVSRFGDDGEHREASAKALATVLHLHRGTPYVYQGEELGMANYPFTTVGQFRDVESLNHYRDAVGRGEAPDVVLAGLRAMSRDNARTPMQWSADPNAGFCPAGTTPWIGVNPDHVRVNAAAQREDPRSVFSHYRRLIELRHTDPVVATGDFTMLLPQDPQVYAFTRTLGDLALLVLANLSSARADVEVPDGAVWAGAQVLLASGGGSADVPDEAAGVGADGRWHAGAWEAVVLRLPPPLPPGDQGILGPA